MTIWISLIMMGFLFLRAFPALVMANGRRPFLMGYILITLLLGWRALEDANLIPVLSWGLELRRVLFPIILIVTFEWAIHRKH